MAALARETWVTLPPPPPWDATQTATVWTIDDVKAELTKVTDTPPRVNFLRAKRLRPEHGPRVDFQGWFRKPEHPLKIRFVDQLSDCANDAHGFVAFADWLALKAGATRGAIAIGWAMVFCRFGFAGIRPGGAHAVVIGPQEHGAPPDRTAGWDHGRAPGLSQPAYEGGGLFLGDETARATFLALAAGLGAAVPPGSLRLPGFPLPVLVHEGGAPKEFGATRRLRELHRGGIHGSDHFETTDADYALLRSDSLGNLAAWLESACGAVDYDLRKARAQGYDGAVFARLLGVATSLAAWRQSDLTLAMPIGVMTCRRATAWGDLPGDGAEDASVIDATDTGLGVDDPPPRQLAPLAEFPNQAHISRIRF